MKFSNGIEIVEYNTSDTDCIAVIGCLKTDKGIKILQELLSWVPNKFHTYIVYQDPPGKLYEYPAMKWAKDVANLFNKPVMYIHTKGAVFTRKCSPFIRNKWKETFYDNYEECIDKLNGKTVYCLYTGNKKIPWYNGFIATAEAWNEAKIILSNDRWYYEHKIWENTNCNVIGKFSNSQNDKFQMTNLMENLLK